MASSERDLTAQLRAWFPPVNDPAIGIGDDAAVVASRAGKVALCCDPVIAGVHFDTDTSLQLVGRKAVNRNLSDLAAMGATPEWLLLSEWLL